MDQGAGPLWVILADPPESTKHPMLMTVLDRTYLTHPNGSFGPNFFGVPLRTVLEQTYWREGLDSIAVSVFVVILVEFDKY